MFHGVCIPFLSLVREFLEIHRIHMEEIRRLNIQFGSVINEQSTCFFLLFRCIHFYLISVKIKSCKMSRRFTFIYSFHSVYALHRFLAVELRIVCLICVKIEVNSFNKQLCLILFFKIWCNRKEKNQIASCVTLLYSYGHACVTLLKPKCICYWDKNYENKPHPRQHIL